MREWIRWAVLITAVLGIGKLMGVWATMPWWCVALPVIIPLVLPTLWLGLVFTFMGAIFVLALIVTLINS